jgi:hypothetical protein
MNDDYLELAGYLMMVLDDSRIRNNPDEYVKELIADILRKRVRIVEDEGYKSMAEILKDMGFGE